MAAKLAILIENDQITEIIKCLFEDILLSSYENLHVHAIYFN